MASRIRSRISAAPLPVVHRTDYPDATPSVIQTGAFVMNSTDAMTDEITPGYFAMRKTGEFLPINPLTSSKRRIVRSDTGKMEWDVTYYGNPAFTSSYEGHVALSAYWHQSGFEYKNFGGSIPSWSSENVLVTDALARARSKGFDVLTFMAEFRKTMNLVKQFRKRTLQRADRVSNHIERLSKGKRSQANLSPAAAFAETWLEARYGWRQIAFDLEAITEAFYKLKNSTSPLIRGYASETNVATNTYKTVSMSKTVRMYEKYKTGYSGGYAAYSHTQELHHETRAGVVLEALIDDITSFDPLVTGWEVVPFSFIIDWFFNIDRIIAAYSPFASEQLKGAWVSLKATTVNKTVVTPGNGGSSNFDYTYSGSPSFELHTEKYTYERKLADPTAELAFRVNLDSLKVTDLASIAFAKYANILNKIRKLNQV